VQCEAGAQFLTEVGFSVTEMKSDIPNVFSLSQKARGFR